MALMMAFLIPSIPFMLLFIPSVEDAAYNFVNNNLSGYPFAIGSIACIARHFVVCAGDYIGCVKQEASQDTSMTYTWQDGKGVMPLLSLGYTEALLHFSHAEYKKVAYDPKAGRPKDALFLSQMSKLPEGVMTAPDLLLNVDTGSAEHKARRTLLADMVPSLRFTHKGKELVVPPTVSASHAAVFGHPLFGLRHKTLKRSVFDMVGVNLYWGLFGIDITRELDMHYEHDALIAPVALGAPVSVAQGKRLAEIKSALMAKLNASIIGKNFVEVANEQGMNGQDRLHELLWIASFAGYGGTGNLAFYTMKHILKEPAKYVKLFRSDSEAFILEAARFYPPVGGMNPFAATKARTVKFANGRTLDVKEGDPGIIFTSNANMDPQVFDEPEVFRPGRSNALRLLSWNNEVGDFRKCNDVAGCPEAPRACPGTHFSIRLVTKVVSFFVGGIEKALGSDKKEL